MVLVIVRTFAVFKMVGKGGGRAWGGLKGEGRGGGDRLGVESSDWNRFWKS